MRGAAIHRGTLVALAALLGALAPARAATNALEALLLAFAQRKDEKVMQALPDIAWQGVRYSTDSEKDNSTTYWLSGTLRLSGFGAVAVPVGAGANQTTRMANEGDARVEVRFSTSTNPALRGPNHVELIKLYPSADYVDILKRNIPGATLVLLAENCLRDALGREDSARHAAFLRVDLPAAPTAVFVRASRNTDGGNSGPGDTTFVFSLFTPGSDLARQGCMLRHSIP